MAILSTIIEAKKTEVRSLPEIRAVKLSPRKGFVEAMLHAHRPSVIAEIKPKSPSQGFLFDRSQIPSLVRSYDKAADAISVLCDNQFFGGGYDLLREVRGLTDKPLLAKEFIIDAKQIHHAAKCGADAILLIVSILSLNQLIEFASTAAKLGLGILLEVHSESDIEKISDMYKSLAVEVQQKILIGINNRDLDSLEVNLEVTERFAPQIRKTIPAVHGIIAESGIHSRDDVVRLQEHVQGFLIGTSILRSEHPEAFLASLVSRKTKVKFCGMTNEEDIVAAEEMGADFIGFIFVSSSPRSVTFDRAIILRKKIERAKTVGVFTDMSAENIEKHISRLHLDYVQLHGRPNIDLCDRMSVPVIQAFRGVPNVETIRLFLQHCPYLLIDKAEGADNVDIDAVAALPESIRSKLFLAGGLEPHNVRNAVNRVQPFAVDCARGIEKQPGIKDHPRLSAFFHALP